MSKAKYEHSDDAALGRWGYQTGRSAPRVTIRERYESNRELALELRWYQGGKRRRRSLSMTIRDDRGRVVPKLRRAAEEFAEEAWNALQKGEDPVAAAKPMTAGRSSGPMKLEDGCMLACDPKSGAWGSVSDRDRTERRTYCSYLLVHLGADLRLTRLKPRDWKSIWVAMEKVHAKSNGKRYGHRTVERTVETLCQVTAYLRRNADIPADAGHPPEEWRKELRAYWQKQKGRPVRPSRPRHTPEELTAMTRAVRDPSVELDPRARLVFWLGTGLRLGAVAARARRQDLDPMTGVLVIHGTERKRGMHRKLTGELLELLRRELEVGYLSELERAYRSGTITDYALFPSGDLSAGKATSAGGRGQKAVGRSWLRSQFLQLENAAGVQHVRGRGWHGLRRAVVDLMKRQKIDPDARNDALGWVKGSRVADTIYANPDDEFTAEEGQQAHNAILDSLAEEDASE